MTETDRRWQNPLRTIREEKQRMRTLAGLLIIVVGLITAAVLPAYAEWESTQMAGMSVLLSTELVGRHRSRARAFRQR